MRISGVNNKISRCMLKILDLNIRRSELKENTPEYLECTNNIKNLEAELESVESLKKKIIDTINKLPNCELKYIVQMYFMSGEKIESIARKVKRTRRHIYDVIGQLRKDIGGNNFND